MPRIPGQVPWLPLLLPVLVLATATAAVAAAASDQGGASGSTPHPRNVAESGGGHAKELPARWAESRWLFPFSFLSGRMKEHEDYAGETYQAQLLQQEEQQRWLQEKTESTPSPVPGFSSDDDGGDIVATQPTYTSADPLAFSPAPTPAGSAVDGDHDGAPTAQPMAVETGEDTSTGTATPSAPIAFVAPTRAPVIAEGATPAPLPSPPTPAPTVVLTMDDGSDKRSAPTTPPTDAAVATATPSPSVSGGGEKDEGEVGGTTTTPGPSAAVTVLEPTPAPTMEGAVSELSGLVTAPSSVLGIPASAMTLRTELRSLMQLEDQDDLVVNIAAPESSDRKRSRRTRRLRGGSYEEEEVSAWGTNGWPEEEEGLEEGNDQLFVYPGESFVVSSATTRGGKADIAWPLDGYATEEEEEQGGQELWGWYAYANHEDDVKVDDRTYHIYRALMDEEETTTAEFTVTFIDDANEDAAFDRSSDAVVKLLNGREDIALSLNTTTDSVIITNLVYSSTNADDIDTWEAESTFSNGEGSASGSAIAIAAAIIAAAVCVTGCCGLTCGKVWLLQQRRQREGTKAKQYQQQQQHQRGVWMLPPTLHPNLASDERGGIGGGVGGTSLGTSERTKKNNNGCGGGAHGVNNAFGRLAPTVSVGGLLGQELSGVIAPPAGRGGGGSGSGRGGQNLFSYDQRSGSLNGGVGAMVSCGGAGRDDMLEHDYGDYDQTESFADGVEGTYSEFGGQSEYDAVVPGGGMNEGLLSDGGSSRFYDDDGRSSEWGTDVGSQHDHGSLVGFPLRKASYRFSAGPRSQASFATPSVAASGRSVESSLVLSRANFPPPSGGAVSPPFGGRGAGVDGLSTGAGLEDDGKGGEGALEDGTRRSDEVGFILKACVEDDGLLGITSGKSATPATANTAATTIPTATSPASEENTSRGGVDGTGVAVSSGEMNGDSGGAGQRSYDCGGGDASSEKYSPAATGAVAKDEGDSGDADGAGRPDIAAVAASTNDIQMAHPTGRPSLDSAAGSAALSLFVPNLSSSVGGDGQVDGGDESAAGSTVGKAHNNRTTGGDGGSRIGRPSAVGCYDDEATSQYAGSSVIGVGGEDRIKGFQVQESGDIGGRVDGGGAREDEARGGDGDKDMMRPSRFGHAGAREEGLVGGATGQKSQFMGGMAVDSCGHDSDGESFVSRVGSYTLTDVGVDTDRGASKGTAVGPGGGNSVRGGDSGGFSPTSTVLRSATGMSELASERDSCGSDGFTNASDSPGAQSGWERAWMRQRNDVRHFGGAGGQ